MNATLHQSDANRDPSDTAHLIREHGKNFNTIRVACIDVLTSIPLAQITKKTLKSQRDVCDAIAGKFFYDSTIISLGLSHAYFRWINLLNAISVVALVIACIASFSFTLIDDSQIWLQSTAKYTMIATILSVILAFAVVLCSKRYQKIFPQTSDPALIKLKKTMLYEITARTILSKDDRQRARERDMYMSDIIDIEAYEINTRHGPRIACKITLPKKVETPEKSWVILTPHAA